MQKSQHEVTGERMTTSQAKKVKVSTERIWKILSSFASFNGSREDSPQSSKSPKTTENIAKLAKESLDIGEILGVKVIDKKEAALKRITSSLKEQRRVRASQKTKRSGQVLEYSEVKWLVAMGFDVAFYRAGSESFMDRLNMMRKGRVFWQREEAVFMSP